MGGGEGPCGNDIQLLPSVSESSQTHTGWVGGLEKTQVSPSDGDSSIDTTLRRVVGGGGW